MITKKSMNTEFSPVFNISAYTTPNAEKYLTYSIKNGGG